MSWEGHIAIDPEVMGGKPVIKGTCMPVQVVVGSLAGGDSIEQVRQGYRRRAEDTRLWPQRGRNR